MVSNLCLWMVLFSVPLFASVIMGANITRPKDVVFDENFRAYWGAHHINFERNRTRLRLLLDNSSGAGFISNATYIYGYFGMKMKLVPGDSAGTVTTFYLMSNSTTSVHDELDFEFLGNRSGHPYLVQTNVFTGGQGNREQQMVLWFDPTKDFHFYSILWNAHLIAFFVDEVPIRVFKNSSNVQGYPTQQPMNIECSLWNGEDWATRGGLEKVNWTAAPFLATYEGFGIDGCGVQPRNSSCRSNSDKIEDLDSDQYAMLDWVERNYITYDYCKDLVRFNTTPSECPSNQTRGG